ncbi:energy-coupling factor ABC transporter permease [Lacimicrobium sp. SS2-24]|uniref:energy-coupling factor ABC transporter permease n=1 Tax=Lacimicrobium sp. SS2-24 TaxID=2005569 RepID=UPI000B4AF777|nr:energy-coupling factor ABC transporter permease [Lacimicrobium sp. SS2-24]
MFESITLLQGLAWGVYIAILATLLRALPGDMLANSKKHQHLLFGSAACLFVLWLFRAGIYQGLNVHFLWLTALTLVLGYRVALLSASIALLGVTLVGKESWSMLGVNGLLGLVLPISLSYLIYNVSFHKLPRHFFIYVFVCAFLPGAMMIALKMLTLGGYYWLENIHEWEVIRDNYLILIPLLLFPEAMLNGMTMTLLVMYKPSWVYTFYDKFYLNDKH